MNAWHKLSVTEASSLLATDVEQGLSVNEAKKRLARYGQNKLRNGQRFSALVKNIPDLDLYNVVNFDYALELGNDFHQRLCAILIHQ